MEEVESVKPWQAVQEACGIPVLLSTEEGTVQAFNSDTEPGSKFAVDARVQASDTAHFDRLVLPGGTTNPDKLRLDRGAMDFVRSYVAAHKPVAAICHGPWSLVEADVVRGKTLTSWPSLQTDIRNAGGHWVDEPVQRCGLKGWMLVTSRKPDDLNAFTAAMLDIFAP
ncbi:protease [Arthrobacter psychrolactophilus]|uniref:Protease n=1 Tax=Arthrobacter psychrolactophilus TaxID=92442 RepID=A0A2V5IKT7_9MICC|nr:type 1 glutamine amidotransferase domain-containing protein [Arthrobacter psychrolactophilus]PYI37278.1 protease [Arthrobacter psychrolactophilus]